MSVHLGICSDNAQATERQEGWREEIERQLEKGKESGREGGAEGRRGGVGGVLE